MKHSRAVSLLTGLAFAGFCAGMLAQPQPGDVFREYRWTHAAGDAGGALRVGGRVGYGGGPVVLSHELDLEAAVRAEIVLEKLLCHDGTRGLAISVNSNAWISVPESPGIPEPQWDFQHHTYPVVDVPPAYLESSAPLQVRLKVSDEHPWNWPQHLIYGVHLRIYYDPTVKPHPKGRVTAPRVGARLGRMVELAFEAINAGDDLLRVDFVGNHEDVNWEGDGRYAQWHHHYVRGELRGQIATATAPPWRTRWDTSWVPDQTQPFAVAAWITDRTGLTYMTRPAEGLSFERDGFSVELCKPYDVPKQWVTRAGEKSERFRITGDLDRAVAAQLAFVSWSPGYLHGILINGRKVFEREGPRYAYHAHRIRLNDLTVLRPGENVLGTAMTPKYDGKMVHGAEINWPGVMVLIQYADPDR